MERFKLIAPHLSKYKRRFSVLDLGSNECGLSSLIANNFDCVVTAIEQNEVKPPSAPRYMLLRYRITALELQRLARCEHFDVVLACNFLHHSAGEWKEMTEAVMAIGDNVFIQLPRLDDSSCGKDILPLVTDLVLSYQPTLLGEVHQFAHLKDHMPRPLWLHQAKADEGGQWWRTLTLGNWEGEPASSPTFIQSDYNSILRHAKHKKIKVRPWQAGINLWNFCCLGGVYPDRDTVLTWLRHYQLPDRHHGDVVPWNFLIDGEKVWLIDCLKGWEWDDRVGLANTVKRVEGMI